MPLFKSKAQLRAAFAERPRKARKWAHESKKDLKSLPEKIHPEKTIPPSEYGEHFKKAASLTQLYMNKYAMANFVRSL